MKNYVQIPCKVPPEYSKALKEIAESEDRSVCSVLRGLIHKELLERSMLCGVKNERV